MSIHNIHLKYPRNIGKYSSITSPMEVCILHGGVNIMPRIFFLLITSFHNFVLDLQKGHNEGGCIYICLCTFLVL